MVRAYEPQALLRAPTLRPRAAPGAAAAVRAFVQAAAQGAGVHRIALVGSLATDRPVPKDADVLVNIDHPMDLGKLARAGRRLKGEAQKINLRADIFLADPHGRYVGRICRYRECHRRVLCHAQHCGDHDHLNDDLRVVTLSPILVASPPVDLWPTIVCRTAVPPDVEAILLVSS